jgi:hypothetical protein
MPTNVEYPGVYVEELPQSVHAIGGVPTSVAAFVDFFATGPVDTPVAVGSWAEFESTFGGLTDACEGSYAVRQFFDNGGTQATAIRAEVPAGGDAAAALTSDPDRRTGLYAFENADPFNTLCIPATMTLGDAQAQHVIAAAQAYCERKRAMYVVDIPQHDHLRATPAAVETWLATVGKSTNAAVYFPRPLIADPLHGNQPRAVAASGTVAGLYARTDATRGVWKAPAGIEAALHGVLDLECALNDAQNGQLNALGVNCLRKMPTYGPVCWGARTMAGTDGQQSDFKYVPVRRMALFIEESLRRGLQWAAFEPNQPALWQSIRLVAGTFLQTLFRQGAFTGITPAQAYFVKCDGETTSQADVENGIVNIVVGFAALRPAEFVVLQIAQVAGKGST